MLEKIYCIILKAPDSLFWLAAGHFDGKKNQQFPFLVLTLLIWSMAKIVNQGLFQLLYIYLSNFFSTYIHS